MKEIFVFGSNLAGRHGKGAALYAKQHYGAVYGQGIGRTGDAWAIPTKDEKLKVLSLDAIRIVIQYYFRPYVYRHLNDSVNLVYKLTPIGCGLAGYKYNQIAPMFYWAKDLEGIIIPKEFKNYL